VVRIIGALHKITFVKDTVEERFTEDTPARLIGVLAYDSDRLDAELSTEGIELISPHRRNRTKPATQDGRALRRYRRRSRSNDSLPGCKTSDA
jgi:hypothetical protein